MRLSHNTKNIPLNSPLHISASGLLISLSVIRYTVVCSRLGRDSLLYQRVSSHFVVSYQPISTVARLLDVRFQTLQVSFALVFVYIGTFKVIYFF